MWTEIILAGLVAVLTTQILQFLKHLKNVSYLPGFRSIFAQFSLVGATIPTMTLNPGLDWQWIWRQSVYKYYGSETISFVPLFGEPMICTASFEVAKQVLSGENFIKAGSALQALLLWGESVLTVNHGDWKKHRRIVGPAFSGTTYALAMRETVRLYYEMVEGEEWSKRDTVMVDAIDLHMSKFTLGIITRCGFGLPFPWVASGDDHEMPFEKALAVVSEEIILRLAAPRWAYKLPIKK